MINLLKYQFRQTVHYTSSHGLVMPTRFKYKKLDKSNYPIIKEDDLEERFIRGSGPGGQAVNMTSNCIFLKHLPTNLTVKCQIYRIASQNRTEARKLLANKLDIYLNGENSIQAQIKAVQNKKSAQRTRKQNKRLEMKLKWKERENQKNILEVQSYEKK